MGVGRQAPCVIKRYSGRGIYEGMKRWWWERMDEDSGRVVLRCVTYAALGGAWLYGQVRVTGVISAVGTDRARTAMSLKKVGLWLSSGVRQRIGYCRDGAVS
jgi:hypothetical protein